MISSEDIFGVRFDFQKNAAQAAREKHIDDMVRAALLNGEITEGQVKKFKKQQARAYDAARRAVEQPSFHRRQKAGIVSVCTAFISALFYFTAQSSSAAKPVVANHATKQLKTVSAQAANVTGEEQAQLFKEILGDNWQKNYVTINLPFGYDHELVIGGKSYPFDSGRLNIYTDAHKHRHLKLVDPDAPKLASGRYIRVVRTDNGKLSLSPPYLEKTVTPVTSAPAEASLLNSIQQKVNTTKRAIARNAAFGITATYAFFSRPQIMQPISQNVIYSQTQP